MKLWPTYRLFLACNFILIASRSFFYRFQLSAQFALNLFKSDNVANSLTELLLCRGQTLL
jgi:hypothetical protein